MTAIAEEYGETIISGFISASSTTASHIAGSSDALGDWSSYFLSGQSVAAAEFWYTRRGRTEVLKNYLSYYAKKAWEFDSSSLKVYAGRAGNIGSGWSFRVALFDSIRALATTEFSGYMPSTEEFKALSSQELWEYVWDEEVGAILSAIDSMYFDRFGSTGFDNNRLYAFRAGFFATENALNAIEAKVVAAATAASVHRTAQKILSTAKSWRTFKKVRLDRIIKKARKTIYYANLAVKAHEWDAFRYTLVREILDVEGYNRRFSLYQISAEDCTIYVSYSATQAPDKLTLHIFSEVWPPISMVAHGAATREYASDHVDTESTVAQDWLISVLSRAAENMSDWRRRRIIDLRTVLTTQIRQIETRHAFIDPDNLHLIVNEMNYTGTHVIRQSTHEASELPAIRKRFCLRDSEDCAIGRTKPRLDSEP